MDRKAARCFVSDFRQSLRPDSSRPGSSRDNNSDIELPLEIDMTRLGLIVDACGECLAPHQAEMRLASGRDCRGDRRDSDARNGFDGIDAEAGQTGWISAGDGQQVCPDRCGRMQSMRPVLDQCLIVSGNMSRILDFKAAPRTRRSSDLVFQIARKQGGNRFARRPALFQNRRNCLRDRHVDVRLLSQTRHLQSRRGAFGDVPQFLQGF